MAEQGQATGTTVTAGSVLGVQTPAAPSVAPGGVAETQTAQSTTPQAPAAPTAPTGDKPWYGDMTNPDTKAWVEKKGFKSAEAAANAAFSLEKLLGADKAGRAIVLPKDAADAEGWNKVYSQLGKPDSPDKYNIPVPDGDSGEFAKSMAPILHAANLTQQQVEVLANGINAQAAAAVEAQKAAREQQITVDLVELKREWGGLFDEQYDLAKRASAAAGINEETSAKLVDAIGAKAAIKIFATLGRPFAEARAKGLGDSQQSGGFGETPQSALERLAMLKSDKAWGARVLNAPASSERKENDRLMAIITAGGLTLR